MSIKDALSNTKAYDAFMKMHRLQEIRIFLGERRRFCKEAREQFALENPKHGSYNDYRKAFWKHRVTYSEYMYSYEYWHLNEEERERFISTSEMQCIYRKIGDHEVRDIFHDKILFLKAFSPLVHRWWALARTMTSTQFKDKLSCFDIIAKPVAGTRGEGIQKITKDGIKDLDTLFARLQEDNYLLEECIEECSELSEFHPSSLNTIRIVTISNKDSFRVFGALFRMGAHNSVVDNTHAGGVYAPINIENGVIETDAIDAHNNHYSIHPDSGKPINGFKIPEWDRIVETCRKAAQTIPNVRFAGWDVCVTSNREIEIIEGNHAPDFDGGMQAPLKVGVKRQLQQVVMDVIGIDPLPFISVWHNKVK